MVWRALVLEGTACPLLSVLSVHVDILICTANRLVHLLSQTPSAISLHRWVLLLSLLPLLYSIFVSLFVSLTSLPCTGLLPLHLITLSLILSLSLFPPLPRLLSFSLHLITLSLSVLLFVSLLIYFPNLCILLFVPCCCFFGPVWNGWCWMRLISCLKIVSQDSETRWLR